jgi:hypothetical protein
MSRDRLKVSDEELERMAQLIEKAGRRAGVKLGRVRLTP